MRYPLISPMTCVHAELIVEGVAVTRPSAAQLCLAVVHETMVLPGSDDEVVIRWNRRISL